MNSPWGNRAEICKAFGWTYDYLLWGISWLNINMMMVDAARIDTSNSNEPIKRIELKTKEDIKKYLEED